MNKFKNSLFETKKGCWSFEWFIVAVFFVTIFFTLNIENNLAKIVISIAFGRAFFVLISFLFNFGCDIENTIGQKTRDFLTMIILFSIGVAVIFSIK